MQKMPGLYRATEGQIDLKYQCEGRTLQHGMRGDSAWKKVARGQGGNTQDKILSSIVLGSIGSHQEILSPRLITCCSR